MIDNENGAETARADAGLNLNEIHDQIRHLILNGALAPGSVVSQVSLARELGVGRTPLREALRMLQHEGLIDAETNRRVRIASFSVEDLEQLYGMRIIMEALACRLTVGNLTDRDIDCLEGALEEMDACVVRNDLIGWRIPHRRFHHILVQYAGDRMVRTIELLSDHAERYRNMKLIQDGLALGAGSVEHYAISRACRDRDPIAAANRLAQHLARTALTVMVMVAPGHEPVAVRTALSIALDGHADGFDGQQGAPSDSGRPAR